MFALEQGECPWGELRPEQLTNVVGFQVDAVIPGTREGREGGGIRRGGGGGGMEARRGGGGRGGWVGWNSVMLPYLPRRGACYLLRHLLLIVSIPWCARRRRQSACLCLDSRHRAARPTTSVSWSTAGSRCFLSCTRACGDEGSCFTCSEEIWRSHVTHASEASHRHMHQSRVHRRA